MGKEEDRKKTILAVDDIVPSLVAIRNILEGKYNVSLAKTIDDALNILCNVPIDLVLLDIAMPEMSGFEFLQLLNRNYTALMKIPVIFVTSHATKEFIFKAYRSGAKDFVVKPVDGTILIDKIEAVFSGKNKQSLEELPPV
jgi:response regulator RpfG family c-di-GMP phosphodiesterase